MNQSSDAHIGHVNDRPTEVMQRVHQKLMQIQNLDHVFEAKRVPRGIPAADPCFMPVVHTSKNVQPTGYLGPKRPVPLTVWVSYNMPASEIQEVQEVMLNYIRSLNKNGREQTRVPGAQGTFQSQHKKFSACRVTRANGKSGWQANRVLALSEHLPSGMGLPKEYQQKNATTQVCEHYSVGM